MIYRIDVSAKSQPGNQAAADPLGESVRRQIVELGARVGPITTRRIFLIDSDADRAAIDRAARGLLADPLVDEAHVMSTPPVDQRLSRIEIHLKPGVMDPVAGSTEMALRDMGIAVKQVRTGRAYLIEGDVPRAQREQIAGRVLANGVIESVHYDAYLPTKFETGKPYAYALRHVPIRLMNEQELQKLSRRAHLFLSLSEMRAIQNYFRGQNREPTDIELETLAQTWSEHCVHKTLKSAVDVSVHDGQGKVIGSRHYKNLIKETIFASTMELMKQRAGEPFCLSVFADNAGVIAFDETDAVCFKVETHNHPSAIEPYGGSATGIGGVIRDILGTGLAAKPVANTDVFCVAFPWRAPASPGGPQGPSASSDAAGASPGRALAPSNGDIAASGGTSVTPMPGRADVPLPRGVIHPRRVLEQVVAGVRDYGNRMGIPTVNGAVYFDDRYLGNPLVFCGCVGLLGRDKVHKRTLSGDAIVVMGGRTGRDGIHGATFSSAELTDTHADEFSHAVQIGNAITEKKVADVILQARDRGLFTAITDCGAGGLSSAVGEMGATTGASVDLEKVPLKYDGLRYDEIWISEAQERMVLSVPKQKLAELLALAAGEDVEATVIGAFGTAQRDLILNYQAHEVGRLSMEFLHDGIPMPTRKAIVVEAEYPPAPADAPAHGSTRDRLLALLAHPNIASKHWIIRQYDHEVQGGSVVKPLVGPLQIGPSDASVVRPKPASRRGVAIGCGLAPHIEDPYQMSLAAIDEAVRNVVAVGADPAKMAILDNFCWPSVDDEKTMGTLVRACEACRDAALAYGIPFISGKDSLHNQFTDSETGRVIRIPATLLISAIGVIEDVRKCVTMDLKNPRDGQLWLVAPAGQTLADRIATHRAMAAAMAAGRLLSCHDVSDGGYLTAVAEMCIAAGLGADLLSGSADAFFSEPVGQYIIEVDAHDADAVVALIQGAGVVAQAIGRTSPSPRLQVGRTVPGLSTQIDATLSLDEMTRAWRGTLDW